MRISCHLFVFYMQVPGECRLFGDFLHDEVRVALSGIYDAKNGRQGTSD